MPRWRGQPHSTVWETGYLLQFLGTVQTPPPGNGREVSAVRMPLGWQKRGGLRTGVR